MPAKSSVEKTKKNGTKVNGNGHRNGANHHAHRATAAPPSAPLPAVAQVTEWDRLSTPSRSEVEQLVEVLKSVKRGDFTVRLPYEKDGILARAGELLNDIIGMNEHMTSELVRVGKVVGQEGKMHERASVGPAKGQWAMGMASLN